MGNRSDVDRVTSSYPWTIRYIAAVCTILLVLALLDTIRG